MRLDRSRRRLRQHRRVEEVLRADDRRSGRAEEPSDVGAHEASTEHERPTAGGASPHGASHIIGLVQIAVIGSGAEWGGAGRGGRGAARRRGCVVVCGGLGEVMEAAARGAKEPAERRWGCSRASPRDANPWDRLPVATGTGHARNLAVVASCEGRSRSAAVGNAAEIAVARLLAARSSCSVRARPSRARDRACADAGGGGPARTRLVGGGQEGSGEMPACALPTGRDARSAYECSSALRARAMESICPNCGSEPAGRRRATLRHPPRPPASIRRRSVSAPALSRNSLRLPHFGDWTQEGSPRRTGSRRAGARVADPALELVVAALSDPDAARVAVVDEDRRAAGLEVEVRREAADVPAVAHGPERKDGDHRVLRGVQRAEQLRQRSRPSSCSVGGDVPDRLGLERRRGQVEQRRARGSPGRGSTCAGRRSPARSR